MKIAINELEHLRQEVKNCHQIIKDLQKKRQWVGLTDDEMSDTVVDMDVVFGDFWKVVCLTKIIEAKLKERNGY